MLMRERDFIIEYMDEKPGRKYLLIMKHMEKLFQEDHNPRWKRDTMEIFHKFGPKHWTDLAYSVID